MQIMQPDGQPGVGWTDRGNGVLANSVFGDTDNVGQYMRYSSVETFKPPFVWSGWIRTRSIMVPPVFNDGTPAWYRPGLVFHPLYPSNNANVLISLGTHDRPKGHVGISAELRDERPPPQNAYGSRSGYARKHVGEPAPYPFWDDEWHFFECAVPSYNHYSLSWDGVMMADVLENSPPTITGGAVRVGLRCDFTRIEIRDFKLVTASSPPPAVVAPKPTGYRIIPRSEVGLPEAVRSSSGSLRPRLSNCRYLTAHYTGNSIKYKGRSPIEITLQIQEVFEDTKPFEYNYVIGNTDDLDIIEYSGKHQAAHSADENDDAVGVLFLLGVGERLTDRMIDKWRWLRDVLIFDGVLQPVPDQRTHKRMPGARTACAGASVDARWPELPLPWQAPTQTPVPAEEEDMNPYMWAPAGYTSVFLITGSMVLHLTPDTYAHLIKEGVPMIREAKPHELGLKSVLSKAGISANDLKKV